MMLSEKGYRLAREFIETHGRPLEAALMRYHFDGAPAREVAPELAKYQNADGGFGHGLEPDLRAPESSPLATSVAFQLIRDLGGGVPAEMTEAAVQYLLQTYDAERDVWRSVPPETDASAHAPWWSQAGLEDAFNAFRFNPTAELLGYLYDYRDLVPPVVLASLTQAVLSRLTGLESMEMHDFLCCTRLAETANLHTPFQITLVDQLNRLLPRTVCTNPAEWSGYCLRPLQVATRPLSPFYDKLHDAIEANLDYEIAAQQEDGSWQPNWSWGGLYPEEWERARWEAAGVLTAEKLRALARFRRIETA
jgi:hypothetical protein